MKKILFISYFFPPVGGIAAIRSMNYAKYLPSNDIEPIVLTVKPHFTRYPKDYTLLRDLKNTHVHRVGYFNFNWIFKVLWGLKLSKLVRWIQQNILVPDTETLWLPKAKVAISKIMMENPEISLVFLTGGPFSLLRLSTYIYQKYRLPYIVEFRDEWTNNPERINLSYPHRSLQRELIWESEILLHSSGVVYLTKYMKANFEKRFPFLQSRPSKIIPNGFDDSDFCSTSSYIPQTQMHLVYCGSFYDRRQPDPLWAAICNLVDNQLIDPSDISIDIYGNNTPRFVLGDYTERRLITEMVHLYPFITHKQSIDKMLGADVLLLYITGGVNTDSILTGKIFDYIRSGKPILAIVPDHGLAAEIVLKSKLGFVADPDKPDAIKTQLLELYKLWQAGDICTIVPNHEYIKQFNRQNLSQDLANLIHEVTI